VQESSIGDVQAPPLLAIEDLHLSTRSAVLVEGINLTVNKGEMVGLLGESGCGKTITALSVLGLLPKHAVKVSRGRILFEQTNMADLGETELNRIRGNRMAMIFQEPMTSLNPIMTIGAQIGEALEIHRKMAGPERKAEVKRLLGLVGLPSEDAQLQRYPFQLSGGQRQRVMIAIALACEPALLIADEPTTALDVTIQAQILDLIAEMRKRFGMACVMVTHDLGVIAETCDRAVVMYAGRIAEQGPVNDLFASPIHRYTQALVGTIPAANPPGSQLPAIPGAVPPPGERPKGCAFAGRCDFATDRCATEPPPEVRRGAHAGYCWNPAS
jgi:oligopeptide/dipeptide ABC transporter ATP-binding protein